ncbi:MAG: hypothetical protein O7D32_07850 [bacterium]|nr:hypothetical protein [bacterium]
MKQITRALAILTVSSLAIVSQANATQVIYRSPKQMGSDAALVVQGTVSGVRSYWNQERSKIFTEATITVSATHKGQNQGIVRVTQLGGVVGNVKMSVGAAIQWSNGEEVLLFLERYDKGSYQVFGFSQGKFDVERNQDTGEAFVRRPNVAGLEMVGAPGADSARPSSAPARVKLDDFLADALGRR